MLRAVPAVVAMRFSHRLGSAALPRALAGRSQRLFSTGPSFQSGLTGTLAEHLDDPSLLRSQAFVGGEWTSTGSTFDVCDPATGEVIAAVAVCGAREVEASVAAAAAAQKAWRGRTGKEKGAVLRRWFDLVQAHSEDLAAILTMEAGKPLAEARGEVTYAASFFEWFSEEAKRAYGDIIPETVGGRRLIATKEPVGVCAMITPWNFPAAMITRKVCRLR